MRWTTNEQPLELNSEHEESIELFMQRAFGAQSLFHDLKYKKHGNGPQKEAADLAWVMEGLVILFWATTKKSRRHQIEHNDKQRKRYLKHWAASDHHSLKGKNRFGDRCDVKLTDVATLAAVSIIQGECGIFASLQKIDGKEYVSLIVGDKFLLDVARHHGSIIDFILLCKLFLLNKTDLTVAFDQGWPAVAEMMSHYWNDAVFIGHPKAPQLSNEERAFLGQIFDNVNQLFRLPDSVGAATLDRRGREILSRILGDMLLAETLALVRTIAETFERAGKDFSPGIVRTLHCYYTIVITATRFDHDPTKVLMLVHEKERFGKDGKPKGVLIISYVGPSPTFWRPFSSSLLDTDHLPELHMKREMDDIQSILQVRARVAAATSV